MELQLQIPLAKQSKNLIDYQSCILLLGSCFSDNIGTKLDYFKFKNLQNPFGILFQPIAIETLIEKTIKQHRYSEKDLFFHNEQWHCFDAHSKLSSTSKTQLLNNLNTAIELTHQYILNSTHIIITLGTAWVYVFRETEKTVANCHKVNQKQFCKRLLSVEEIANSLKNTVHLINSINTQASIIFTVSPVRHIKDGFIENTLSKAHLISGIHQFLNNKTLNQDFLHYFPSYEIMMDELRDYRFYKEDMVHPNNTAINYIWEKFQNVWLDLGAFKTMDDVSSVQKGLQHKAFNPQSKAHLQFLQNLKAKIQQLQNQFPHIEF